jgi:hypothetical protein
MVGMVRGQGSRFIFRNGKNDFRRGTTMFLKGIYEVAKVNYQGQKLCSLMVSGPREGMRTEAFLSPTEAEMLGQHLIRVAKDLRGE